MAAVEQAGSRYHRLLLVVGGAGAGKTQALALIGAHCGASLVNVGLEVTRRLLETTARQRPLQIRRILEELIHGASADSSVVLLDNIEVLFHAELQQDPLRLLQGVSRDKTLVVAWTGTLRDGTLHCATPGHREYREYSAARLLTVALPLERGREPL